MMKDKGVESGLAHVKSAFILRMSHRRNRVPEAVRANQIMVGWAETPDLLKKTDWESFRQTIHDAYHEGEEGFRGSGSDAGHAWRFLKDMQRGSLVVVPSGTEFWVAEVTGPATFDRSKVDDDSAYRRPVRWLNGGRPIPRSIARAALQSRMKVYGTTADASDLIGEIRDALAAASEGPTSAPTLADDLRARLTKAALEETRSGRLDSFGFERLVASILERAGGTSVRIIPRRVDKGADITAQFRVAGALSLRVAVQAKHYQKEPPIGPDVLEDLRRGMTAENADYGIVVTSGSYSDTAVELARELHEKGAATIALVDGEQLAGLIVDLGYAGGAGRLSQDTDEDSKGVTPKMDRPPTRRAPRRPSEPLPRSRGAQNGPSL